MPNYTKCIDLLQLDSSQEQDLQWLSFSSIMAYQTKGTIIDTNYVYTPSGPKLGMPVTIEIYSVQYQREV